jgi:hypothetical protein
VSKSNLPVWFQGTPWPATNIEPIDEFVAHHTNTILKSDRAIEATVAALVSLGRLGEVHSLGRVESALQVVSEQRRLAVSMCVKQTTLERALEYVCGVGAAVGGSLLLWRLPMLFSLLEMGRQKSTSNKRLATECALRWPALSEVTKRFPFFLFFFSISYFRS